MVKIVKSHPILGIITYRVSMEFFFLGQFALQFSIHVIISFIFWMSEPLQRIEGKKYTVQGHPILYY